MTETASSVLTSWSNFYLMTGSAAAALTGLMFVVITLITTVERLRRDPEGISTFNTPTVAHFGMALFVSAVLNAPWRSLAHLATLLILVGLAGVGYVLRVMFRTRRLSAYSPDLEDWTWYSILPFLAYAAILAGAIMLYAVSAQALFAIAGGVLLLIFIGIRNAWDIVTYIAIGHGEEPPS
ncbi:hypothetical protein EPN44_00995 [bacterium]|nr:MAG: hypothetical protein EPN44_00995 [bacterium]